VAAWEGGGGLVGDAGGGWPGLGCARRAGGVAAQRAVRTRARERRCVLLAALVCSALRIASAVPMGMRDLEDGDSVPPPHYGTKHLDLGKPRPVVGSGDAGEDDFEELPNQERAPPRPRAIPQPAQMQSLQEEDGFGRNPGEEAAHGQEPQKSSVWAVAFNTLLMAVASGLGAAPFFFVSNVNRKWLGIANALASGVMLAASFGLVQEGLDGVKRAEHSLLRLVAGMLLGLVFIIVSQVRIAFAALPCGLFACRGDPLYVCRRGGRVLREYGSCAASAGRTRGLDGVAQGPGCAQGGHGHGYHDPPCLLRGTWRGCQLRWCARAAAGGAPLLAACMHAFGLGGSLTG
jgi:hypothetical protein